MIRKNLVLMLLFLMGASEIILPGDRDLFLVAPSAQGTSIESLNESDYLVPDKKRHCLVEEALIRAQESSVFKTLTEASANKSPEEIGSIFFKMGYDRGHIEGRLLVTKKILRDVNDRLYTTSEGLGQIAQLNTRFNEFVNWRDSAFELRLTQILQLCDENIQKSTEQFKEDIKDIRHTFELQIKAQAEWQAKIEQLLSLIIERNGGFQAQIDGLNALLVQDRAEILGLATKNGATTQQCLELQERLQRAENHLTTELQAIRENKAEPIYSIEVCGFNLVAILGRNTWDACSKAYLGFFISCLFNQGMSALSYYMPFESLSQSCNSVSMIAGIGGIGCWIIGTTILSKKLHDAYEWAEVETRDNRAKAKALALRYGLPVAVGAGATCAALYLGTKHGYIPEMHLSKGLLKDVIGAGGVLVKPGVTWVLTKVPGFIKDNQDMLGRLAGYTAGEAIENCVI